MNKSLEIKKYMLTAMCITLCVVLPQAFHFIPNFGMIFLPMHIPVLLCGLTCGAPFGFLCGMVGPILSSLFKGMPPVAILPSMLAECAVYGTVSGLLMNRCSRKRLSVNIYISLIVAMITGRIFAGIVQAFILSTGEVSISAWISTHFIVSFPGIVIQLLILPQIVTVLRRASLVPELWEKKEGKRCLKVM